VKRKLCVVAIALGTFAAACGGGSAAQMPTPQPSGQRGGLLNQVDKTQNTVNQLNSQQKSEEQQTGAGYP
jgi:hypothetical protein